MRPTTTSLFAGALCVACALISSPANAGEIGGQECEPVIDLGPATGFNVFSCMDLYGEWNIGGRVAVAERAVFEDVELGYDDPGGDTVTVGINTAIGESTVHGNAVYGLNGFDLGGVTFTHDGTWIHDEPIDFATACDDLVAISAELAATPATAEPLDPTCGVVDLVGDDPVLNVFEVDTLCFGAADAVTIEAPPGSKVLVNVRGEDFVLFDTEFLLDGVDVEDVLFNLPDATWSQLNDIEFRGSLLAPNTLVSFQRTALEGTAAVGDMRGCNEFFHAPFDGGCEPICGDGMVEGDEDCDDGNLDEYDGCSPDCTVEESVCDMTVLATATPDTIVASSPPDCDDTGKPTSLTFRYTAGGCEASDNGQDAKKVDCDGSIEPADPVEITAYGKKTKEAYTVTPDLVVPGGEFTLEYTKKKDKAEKLKSESHVVLTNGGGTETNEFHTSCSQPLAVGDVFGSITLVAINGERIEGTEVTWTYEVTNLGSDLTDLLVSDDLSGDLASGFDLVHGETQVFTVVTDVTDSVTSTVFVSGYMPDDTLCEAAGSATVLSESPPLSCDDGKAAALVMTYTGEDCSASYHLQDEKKVSCEGDPALADPVYIVAGDKDDPDDAKGRTWFEGEVPLDDTFTIDAATGGSTKLKAETHVFVYDLAGDLLQSVEFHTSCSQPLSVYDQFGSLLLVEFIPE